ncbi:MAG: hypothetical protein LIP05_16320 [Tannerellaceae bacterium]|nr:hypothetical protein [Tannerellaceae bacterium]
MNYIPKLIVEGYGERWLTHYQQEYRLTPKTVYNDRYLEFLIRYFPYDFSDSIRSRDSVNLNYQPTAKDRALADEARDQCSKYERGWSLYSLAGDLDTYSGFFLFGIA